MASNASNQMKQTYNHVVACAREEVYSETIMAIRIFQQMYSWMPWILEQAKQEITIRLDFSIYLEGIHCILLLQSKPMNLTWSLNLTIEFWLGLIFGFLCGSCHQRRKGST